MYMTTSLTRPICPDRVAKRQGPVRLAVMSVLIDDFQIIYFIIAEGGLK